jgi:hypothetical protein
LLRGWGWKYSHRLLNLNRRRNFRFFLNNRQSDRNRLRYNWLSILYWRRWRRRRNSFSGLS